MTNSVLKDTYSHVYIPQNQQFLWEWDMSKPSNSVQPSNTVRVRIVQLKNSGLGYRRIAKRLKEEGLADISKSTVANRYHQHLVAFNEEIGKQFENNEEFQVDREKQLRLQREIVQLEAEKQIHQRTKDLYLQKASMPKGVRQIFNVPGELFDFAQCIVGNSEEWRKLKDYCANHHLSLEASFHNAVGSLEKYEKEVDQGTSSDLDFYVKFEINSFLYVREKEEKAKRFQKKFQEILFTAKCSRCETSLTATLSEFGHPELRSLLIVEGQIQCVRCNTRYNILCPNCKTGLTYNGKEEAFHCPSCKLIFPLPQPKEKPLLNVSLPVELKPE